MQKQLFLVLLGLGVAVGVVALFGRRPAYALPEYALRTGEPCMTCHVNPGGGGRLTMRGLLWGARGRPDRVPPLPNVLLAPGIESGEELYRIACASCHGRWGEGLVGGPLAHTTLNRPQIEAALRRGRLRSGMPAFGGRFTAAQLRALVDYVVALGMGQVEPPPTSYPLDPIRYVCRPIYLPPVGGQSRGN